MADSKKPAATSDSQSVYSAPTISLPKGGGAIRGIGEKFGANPVTGTGSMTVPIATSPGRSNFGPQLSLSYDSGAGNGPFGFGWSISIPGISRKTDKGLPQYRDDIESDVYIISGAEDLVPVLRADGSRFVDEASVTGYTIARYRPRIEGLFARIERWTNGATGEIHWRSISRDNITTLYGKTPESRVADPDDSSRVFTWLLCESYDSKGNAMVYRYSAEDDAGVDVTLASEQNRARLANRYLKRILYGNRVSRLIEPDLTQASWLFEVVFDYDEGHYEDLPLDPAVPEAAQHRYVLAADNAAGAWRVRPDSFSSYRATFEVRTYRRCHRILMFHHFAELGAEPCLVRSTEFDYGDLDYSQPVPIDAELAHQGSTRFASFIRAVTHSGFVRDETRPVVERDGARCVTYLRKSLPPLEFEYSKAVIQEDIREVDDITLENLPIGVDGSAYQWVDLDGEGVSGILTDQADAWFYKPSLGDGHFGPIQRVGPRPSPVALTGGKQQLLDLAGDGQLDVVSFTGAAPGFYERTEDDTWEPLRSFRSLPNIAWDDPNLRFVDLDGDGHADILLTEHEAFTWYPSLAEDGFGPPITIRHSPDEERGTRLVFADGTQSIYLADMTGDGLTDLVRIRNGEVCYWPSEGYCRFGPKVTMDGAPWLDEPDQFDHRRLLLADIDGSGTTDIVYTGRAGPRIYFNQAGNRWRGPRVIEPFPLTNDPPSVVTADLLGNGTACLVWSSSLPGDSGRRMRYLDLMGGQKPHLLVASRNNLGAETRVKYTSSTRFYLDDKLAGNQWITRLPFPVYVVERVETYDWISGNRFVTRYAYHDGYFDGPEREFRGFGLVEQWDTEEFAALNGSEGFPVGANVDESSHVPPVLTRSWFHTGVHLGREHVSDFFAGLIDARDAGKYYREPGLTDAQAKDLLLDDTVLPEGMSVEEEREACRALKGSLLRQEIYARDNTEKAKNPYTVTEQNFTIHRLQLRGRNRHAVFLAHPRESISYHYERIPADPRIGHVLTLDVDDFGNIRKSVTVGYGRRLADPILDPQDQVKQKLRLVTYAESDFTNGVDELDDYRAPMPADARTYELTGYTPTAAAGRYQAADFARSESDGVVLLMDSELQYEESPASGKQRRLIGQVRTLYRRDDLVGALPLGQLQAVGLPFEEYRLAFTPGLTTAAYGSRVTAAMLADEGRFVHSEGDANWWAPSGQVFYSPDTADTPTQELAYARRHFFLPHRYRDPFHTNAVVTERFVSYDYDLLVQETRDALDNRVTVGERNVDPSQPLVRSGQDYRVLQPAQVMDPNRNRSAVAFDAFGLVAGTAVSGKPEDTPVRGDRLTTAFRTDLTEADVEQFLTNPNGPIAAVLLDQAATRVVYDLTRYWRDSSKKRAAFAATLARETHASDPPPDGGLRIQVSCSFSDGFGREIQRKIQAEGGPVPKRDIAGRIIVGLDGAPEMTPNDVSPRWVGTGWTVFNNKGKPVRQYEPFFTDTHDFEFNVRIGVSPVFFYDPLERVVATLRPNHTWEKVVSNPWRQDTWDVNDTVLIADPKTDPDVGDFFSRLPDADYVPSWYALRTDPTLASAAIQRWPDPRTREDEKLTAEKASVHAATPKVVHADTLGRPFLTVANNQFKYSDAPAADPPVSEFHFTRMILDIKGGEREVIDAKDRVVVRFEYNVLGNRIHQASMESGERWTLDDATGKPLYTWDSRNHRFRSAYDPLRRLTDSFLREGVGAEALVGHTIYGETRPNPETTNLRGQVVQLFDQAGIATSDDYDFKGNLLGRQRRLAREYKAALDWSVVAAVQMEPETYTSRTSYDALDRPTQFIAPHSDQPGTNVNVIQPVYNEANLLEHVDAWLNQHVEPAGPFSPNSANLHAVTNIDYDAKGQRALIDYGNGVRTTFEYDRFTFRLTRLLTRRGEIAFPDDCPQQPPSGWPGCQVQNLYYTYDPVGNITHIRDDAQQTLYFRNRRVEPSSDFLYDSVNRLIEATGREHLGQTSGAPNAPTAPDALDGFHSHPSDPRDGNAMGAYLERYVYDFVGNILTMQHRGSDPANPGWTRTYTYGETSQLEGGKKNNRLSNTLLLPSAAVETAPDEYQYDNLSGAHGNITGMTGLTLMRWDYRDQLQGSARESVGNDSTPETTWYVYDAGGQRVRKVTESKAGAGQTPIRMKERIYIGGFEIYREYAGDGTSVRLQRETLPIMDDRQRIALVETRTDTVASEQLIRYQFGNHLGSATLELGDDAKIISYEEYFPYGSASYQAMSSLVETPKRYRYTGKELDEENGLYYYGARYSAAWLGRWVSPDPAGIADGLSLYVYARGNPVTFVDRDGRATKQVFLTFDDGPSRDTTPKALNALDKAGVKATFFVRGDHIKGNEDILFDIAKRGHFIGNHTFTHPTFADKSGKALITDAKILEEFTKTDTLIKDTLDSEKKKAQAAKTWDKIPEAQRNYIDSVIANGPQVYRVPQFSQNEAQKKLITANFANPRAAHVDPHDADTLAVDKTLTDAQRTQRVVDNILNGEPATTTHPKRLGVRDQPFNDVVVLQHDTLGFTVDAIPEIIKQLKAEGQTFGGQLPDKPAKPAPTPPPTPTPAPTKSWWQFWKWF